jgi:ribonucleoside-diphosphate reductase alpha chain
MSNGKLSDNAIEVSEDRYFMENEDWEMLSGRVGQVVAGSENSHAVKYAEEFSEIIFNVDFLPGGRILRNAGRARGSLFNCYHLPIGDSREEIGQFYKDSLILWGEGGGIGVNASSLRPKGAPIKGVGGYSSGPVSFLEASDAIAGTIESGGSRRAAALALMSVSHPDVTRFIDAKLVHGILSHYNISVAVTDEFLEAVESDDEWEFKFAHQTYGKVKARSIWDKIINNMVNCAEPGLLNWNNLIKNNSYYYDPVMGTNPCGEAVLSPYDVCDLGSLVLTNFITGTVNTNWKKLYEVIKISVRFLDDVIDINKYVLKEIDIKAHNSRRIGLGVMGLADYLFAKGLRYGSNRSIVEVERLMRFIRDTVYETLVELAQEKGAFPKFDPVPYGKASFIRKLPASLRMDIKEHGVRCVTGLAIAPTGTISLLAGVNSGIEPLFRKAYLRSDRVSERMYVHPIYRH